MGGVDCDEGEEDEDGVDDVDEHCVAAEGVGLGLLVNLLAFFRFLFLEGVLKTYSFPTLPIDDYEG